MTQKEIWWYTQSGVIPYRAVKNTNPGGNLTIEILLITSCKRQRWIIPKGIVEPGMPAHESAEKEALEEAGILGTVSLQALGTYRHKKWGGTCDVEVFPLEVDTVLEEWPEMHIRQRKWMSPDEAIACVRNERLKQLIALLSETFQAQHIPSQR